MKWIAGLLLAVAVAVVAACGAGDDTTDGTRAKCAFGGALNDCPDADKSTQGVCWRLVDCGAIDVDVEDPNDPNRFDWGRCVDVIDGFTADRRQLVIECISAMTCDELRTNDFCFEFGRGVR